MATILDELLELNRYVKLIPWSLNVLVNIASLSKLGTFPPEAHWLCPKRNDDDIHNYDELDLEEPNLPVNLKAKYVAEGQKRFACAYRFSLVLGLSAEEA